jgi:hypothetical protein
MTNHEESSVSGLGARSMEESSGGLDGTRVDLGEDLIEKTAFLTGFNKPEPVAPVVPSHQPEAPTAGISPVNFVVPESGLPEDLLESAKILVAEGLATDAKKLLHHLLIRDPGNVAAQKALEELQEKELAQIFGEGEVRRSYQKKDRLPEEVNVEAVIRSLDQDLDLGLFSLFEDDAASSPGRLSLFRDEKLLADFGARVEKDLAGSAVRDWIDLGIGFLEMEIYSIAARLFTGAIRRVDPVSSDAKELMISGVSLLGLSYILMDLPHQAISNIQPVLRDSEIKFEDKIELYYLMGRSYEILKKNDLVRGFYEQVREIDASYRDVAYRLAKLRG